MILGIGTDILKISRLEEMEFNPQDPFFIRVFSGKELEEALRRDNRTAYLCTRFAGKEAVFKALSPDLAHVDLNEIEILSLDSGKPYVTMHRKILQYSMEKGIDEILISLSYDTEYAIAYAIAQGSGTALSKEAKK